MTELTSSLLLDRYEQSLLGVFGRPLTVLDHGEGCYVVDVDGKRYLDLLGGIAVNVLGHAHPAVVSAVTEQVARLIHVSNFFTTRAQIELAERLLVLTGSPTGSAVYFANSGTEAIEAAIKLSRRTGRRRLLALEGAFHGRTMGAVSLTHKPAYREPFAPLLESVAHLPRNDQDALRAAVDDDVAALFIEPIQGEAGVLAIDTAYLRLARELTREHGALLVVDEIQTGIGRTGDWFAFQRSGITPDAIAIAKGLGGGVPIGALITIGHDVSRLLTPGQHGTTFGGNPLACAAGVAVLATLEQDGLVAHAREVGDWFMERVAALGHPLIKQVRGSGLLIAIELNRPVAVEVATEAREGGFIVNPTNPHTLRLAPPLIITTEQLDSFVDFLRSLPAIPDLPATGTDTTGRPTTGPDSWEHQA